MKITNLTVINFRAIGRVEMADLGEMITIAGPNGCGKSCILDSIRLLKSVYGGYQPNEWQQWFGEFQIDFQRNPQQMVTLLRDRSKPLTIELSIELDPQEVMYMKQEEELLVEKLAWQTVLPGSGDPWLRSKGVLAADLRAHKPAVDQKKNELLPRFREHIECGSHVGRLEITPSGGAKTSENILLEILFSSYDPKHLGLIDYHGSHRNYGRERLKGINLNLDVSEDKNRQHTLYNYGNKYANIKSEMAADYVRQLLQEKSGVDFPGKANSLADTLKELFTIFFPGKIFEGPVATQDGDLDFHVSLDEGGKHDINDLSSGEKEVLFGYLRLRNSAPKYSVILLDEPELHLNPALVRGLPQFYHRHLGTELGNQIWLVTHSDAFLRESVGSPGITVYHMQYSPHSSGTDNQVHEVRADEEIETAILDLVGDLAAYRPGAKVIFFEGEDSEFDLKMVSRLFPEAEKSMNFVSGGNRARVERLHRTLEESVKAGKIPIKIYSIVDKDSGSELSGTEFKRHFSWDVYHIENYLLEPKFILESLKQVGINPDGFADEDSVDAELREIAREKIASLVVHTLRESVGKELIHEVKLNPNVEAEDLGEEMHRVIINSVDRIQQKVAQGLDINTLREKSKKREELLEASLADNNWKEHFRGRDVLREFVGRHVSGMRYEYFRDLIVSTMVNSGYKPIGMAKIIEKILDD